MCVYMYMYMYIHIYIYIHTHISLWADRRRALEKKTKATNSLG